MLANKKRFLKEPICVILTLNEVKGKDLFYCRDSSPLGLRMTAFCGFFKDLKKLLIFLFVTLGIWTSIFAQGEFVYDAKGKRNPFIPLVTPEGRLIKLDKQEVVSTGGLAIEGIIYDKQGRSFAIVNAQVLGVGDMAQDYQVLKIYENKVVFIKDGEPFEVELTNTPR